MDTLVLDPTQDPAQDVQEPARILQTSAVSARPRFFRREVDSSGICWLTFDTQDAAVNIWNEASLFEFNQHLADLENAADLKALVIRSGKDRIFIAGADLKSLRSLSPSRLEGLIQLGQDVFTRLSRLPLVKIVAIHGACVGGGFELALACDYRIASDSDSTRIGLPETQLGLIPAWGGSTRLPRLIGLSSALELIASGRLLRAEDARRKGLVDQVVPVEHLHALAERFATHTPAHERHFHWSNWPVVNRLLGFMALRKVKQKTRSLYPAPLKAIEVASHGIRKSLHESLMMERVAMTGLLKTDQTARLIDLFFRKEAADKHKVAKGTPLPVHDAAVIGAGIMGSGIAHWLATKGVRVLLCDVNDEALAQGLGRIDALLAEAMSRRLVSKTQARDTMDRIHATCEKAPLHHCQLVIEAATENLDLKKRIFADIAMRCAPDTVLATNTSALPVGELAGSLPHPERVIGLHFFNPVHRMPLVEVVRMKNTSDDSLATAVAFVQRLGKTPVIVQDSPGFVVNRILMPYLMEAVRLFDSGVPAQVIDDAMLDFGMPMGPLRLLDEIGLDVAAHVGRTLTAAYPERFAKLDLFDRMIELKRLGRKTGEGFYRHTVKSAKENPEARELSSSLHQRQGRPNSTEIQTRLALVLSNEAARCLADDVAAGPQDIDLAMILGTGYPAFRGGPLEYANAIGLENAATELRAIAAATPAPHPFEPAPYFQRQPAKVTCCL